MRKKTHILTILGILFYVIYLMVNRFVYQIPNQFALPILITTMLMIIIGAFLQQKRPRK